jgi:hypothetical protein
LKSNERGGSVPSTGAATSPQRKVTPDKPAPDKSMSGKPTPVQPVQGKANEGAGRPSKPSANRTFPGQTFEGKPAGQSSAAGAVPFDLGDDPLAVKATSAHDAIPAGRQRTKSRPHKVICPMCETVGYIPQSAAGKDVRCANPKCLVPVFVAPRIQRKVVEAAPQPKSSLPTVLIGSLVLLGLLGGGGAWYIVTHPSPENTGMKFARPVPTANGTAPTVTANVRATQPKEGPQAGEQPAGEQANVTPVVAEKPLLLADEREPVLAIMAHAAQESERNLRPPYCQRLTAQTAADCGDLVMAKTFLERLAKGKRELAFYRVGPLTSIAWQQLKTGDKAATAKTLDDALVAAADLPAFGRASIDSAAWLAAALVAGGRDREAQTLTARFPASGSTGRLFAAMSTASAWNGWDTVAAQRQRSLLDVASLQCPVVVEIAVSRGFPAEALRFAESLADPALRSECQIAWCEAVTRAGQLGKLANSVSIDPILQKLKPAPRARLHARVGIVRLSGNDHAGAEKSLELALASLGTVDVKPEFTIPSLKGLYALRIPDATPARLNALALAEIARLEGALDKRDAARNHIDLAIGVLRASAPSPVAARLKLEDLDKHAAPAGRNAVRALLKLKNDEQARMAVDTCRKNCKDLIAAAETRFALQTEILETALAWEDAAHLWKEIGTRATAEAGDQREPYFDTLLPWQLAINLQRTGDKPAAEKISEAAGASRPPAAAVLDLLAERAAETKDINALARQMQSLAHAERADHERAALAGSSYLLHSGNVGGAFQFVRMFDDSLLKEESLQWTAALACRLNFTRLTKETLRAASFIPTESVSAWRGFLLGLLARETSPEAAPPGDATGKPQASQPKQSL